jgi:hypothetical protein
MVDSCNFIIFIGDVDDSVRWSAKAYDHQAWLISEQNVDSIDKMLKNQSTTTAYTSLGDLPKDLNVVFRTFNQATKLVYCPPLDNRWSDGKTFDPSNPTSSVQGLTEYILTHFAKTKNNVENLSLSAADFCILSQPIHQRCTTGPQLWMAGCSHTYGEGVDADQTYGHHIASALHLPMINLACPASSIAWSADQILRSDIQPNDLIVWGITSENRLLFYQDQELHVVPEFRKHTNLELPVPAAMIDRLLADDTNLYQALVHIYQVLNFAKKAQAQILLLGLLPSPRLNWYLKHIPEYVGYVNVRNHGQLLDFGSDNKHPGPLQHRAYADFCLSQLEILGYLENFSSRGTDTIINNTL